MKVFFSGSKRISEPGVTVFGILDGLMRSGEEILSGIVPGRIRRSSIIFRKAAIRV